ncbi:MAG: rplC [Parcubacteria group bacterium]|nr:rplC [Parcubacteria group bacterium]
MKFILARKGRMTQVFEEDGRVNAGTVLTVSPNVITQVKTAAIDGYSAVQVGTDVQKVERLAKAQAGKAFKVLKEFRVENPGDFTVGSSIAADMFEQGETVVVAGTSKGKGFQGVVKRHGFHGGRRSHGQKHSEREAGSIGGGPGRAGGRVTLGMKMAGRMGGERVTVPNLKVLRVDAANNQIIVSGAVPGAVNSIVEIIAK